MSGFYRPRREDFADCYGCKERSVGCHGVCERYAAAKKTYNERRNQYKRNRASDRMINDYVIESVVYVTTNKKCTTEQWGSGK